MPQLRLPCVPNPEAVRFTAQPGFDCRETSRNGFIQMDDAGVFAGSVEAFLHQRFSCAGAVKT
jgi:hypothetical protein